MEANALLSGRGSYRARWTDAYACQDAPRSLAGATERLGFTGAIGRAYEDILLQADASPSQVASQTIDCGREAAKRHSLPHDEACSGTHAKYSERTSSNRHVNNVWLGNLVTEREPWLRPAWSHKRQCWPEDHAACAAPSRLQKNWSTATIARASNFELNLY